MCHTCLSGKARPRTGRARDEMKPRMSDVATTIHRMMFIYVASYL